MFKNVLRIQVEKYFPRNVRGRPSLLTFDDAYDDILKVVRTGMQWRHLTPKHVSFITVFKTMHKWIAADLFRTAYQTLLRLYSRKRRPRYYCVDSSFVKNIYGSDCVGRNPTDRGRKATKMSAIVGRPRCSIWSTLLPWKSFRLQIVRTDAGLCTHTTRTRKGNVW